MEHTDTPTAAPPTTSWRRHFHALPRNWEQVRDYVRRNLVAAFAPAAVPLAGAVLVLLAWFLAAVFDGAVTAARWLTDAPLTRTITDPVRAYLDTQAGGVPLSATQLWWLWLVAVIVLFLSASFLDSRGARLGWTLVGALTVAMVWAGSAVAQREIAAGVTVVAWSLLSVLALNGTSVREHVSVVVLRDRRHDPD